MCRNSRIAAAVGLALLPSAALATQPVDIELVLAIDLSGSVDGAEQALQRDGLAAAFRDREVVDAIGSLAGGAAMALVGWAGAGQERMLVPWCHLSGRASAADFADRIAAALPARFDGPAKTAIGDALAWSLAPLASNAFTGRRVVDVAGDGRSTDGAYPGPERDKGVAAGATINGLVILNEEPYLDEYYRLTVIGGPGAFVMSIADYGDYAVAIRRKLLRELAPGPTASQ